MTNHHDPRGDLRGPTLRDLLTPIFRHKRAGILTAVALFTAAALTVFLLPKQYESEMTLLVKRERLDSIVSSNPNVAPQLRVDVTEDELNSEVELLKSRDLLEQVAQAAGLYSANNDSAAMAAAERVEISRIVRTLERDLRITPLRRTTLIRVSYRSPDPVRSARVLKELSRLYLEKHLNLHRSDAYDFFTEQAERFRAELTAAETRLREYGRKEQVVSADIEKVSTLQKLADFEAVLQQTHGEIADANLRISELEAQEAATPSRQTTQIRTTENVALTQELKSKVLSLEVKRTEMLRVFTPKYPPVVELEQELAQTREALERTEQAPLKEETTDQNPTHQWLRSELARVRAERAAAVARAAARSESVRVYREKARQLDEKGTTQQDLKRAMSTAEENYLLYRRKQEEARISDAMDRTRIANVAVAEEPNVPALPSSTGRPLQLALGALMSLMLGIAVTFLLDYLSPYLRTPGEVETALDIPVLASLRAGK